MAVTAAGETVHLVLPGRGGPLCGSSTPTEPLVDLVGRRVCVSCARRLPKRVQLHLATAGRPSAEEKAPVHVRRARLVVERARTDLEGIRLDSVLDDTVGHHVLADDGGQLLTFGGPTVSQVPMTVGLFIGSQMPGASEHVPPTSASAAVLRPSAPGRFPADRGPLLSRQQPSRRRA